MHYYYYCKYEYFRIGKRQEGKQTITCAVQVQVQTQLNNKSTLCVHSGLKCDNLNSKSYYIDCLFYTCLLTFGLVVVCFLSGVLYVDSWLYVL